MNYFKTLSFSSWIMFLSFVVLFVLPFTVVAGKSYHKNNETKSTESKKVLAVQSTPSQTPTPTEEVSYVPSLATPVPSVTVTPTPSTTATSNAAAASSEQLTVSSFDPLFLWADYQNLGYQYVVIHGTGFTSQTTVELFVSSVGEPRPSNYGQVYHVGNVSLPSSHEWWGTLPSGLYNSYYSVRVRNADGSQVETGPVLVVSGNTEAAGTAPHPESDDPTPTQIPTAEPSVEPTSEPVE